MSSYKLFEVVGIELEYMIVSRQNFDVRAICDQLLFNLTESYCGDFENGTIDWSNELAQHVLEFKVASPVRSIESIEADFHQNILKAYSELEKFDATLLPTSVHPWMNPETESGLWQHENRQIYERFDKIFGCRTHGWLNLQSTHLNFPFSNDDEFRKLHAAIRVILPIIPAICASSPIRDGSKAQDLDSRLEAYLKHEASVPELMGMTIPEMVKNEEEYNRIILSPIQKQIEKLEATDVLKAAFVNARGAIARFDRGSIEIRLADIQEAPKMDLSIASLIQEVLRHLVENMDVAQLEKFHENELFEILRSCIKEADLCKVDHKDFLKVLGLSKSSAYSRDIWEELASRVSNKIPQRQTPSLTEIFTHGTLSRRILKASGSKISRDSLTEVYRELSNCLKENRSFLP